MLVELEEPGVRPDVRAVAGHEDRDVAHERDVALPAPVAEALPLPEEEELAELAGPDGVPALLAPAGQRLGAPARDVLVPLRPFRPALRLLDRHVQGVIVEPRGVLRAERIEGRAVRGRSAFLEAAERAVEQGKLEGGHRVVVHGIRRHRRRVRDVRGLQPSVLDERVEADEQRVAREGGEALVGRVAVTGGAEGQHLPEALARASQEVHEAMGLGPQLADPVAPRQGRRVQQDPAPPRVRPGRQRQGCGGFGAGGGRSRARDSATKPVLA
jgi:hypothetical protein